MTATAPRDAKVLGALALACSVAYLIVIPLRGRVAWQAQLAVKVLPALLWGGAVHAGDAPRKHRSSGAFVFYAYGDAFLACPPLGPNGFTLGLAAFLLGHLCHISAFGPERDASLSARATGLRVVPYLAVFGGMYGVLWAKLVGALHACVGLYAAALTGMAATTAVRSAAAPDSHADSYVSAVVGSTFFLVTDGLLSISHFKVFGPMPDLTEVAIMGTYFCALAGLARAKVWASEAAPPSSATPPYRPLPAADAA